MAAPRSRSHPRRVEGQQQYELQNMQTLRRSSTGEGSTAHSEGSYDDRHHGHPENTRAQRLDQGMLRRYKARSAGILRGCMAMFVEQGRAILFLAFVMCVFIVFIIWTSLGLNSSPKPFDYGLGGSTGQTKGQNYPTITITHSHTLYRIVKVYDKQFHDARPVHHHQAPIALPSNLESRDETKRQGLTHPHEGRETSASVSGLYLIPMSITKEDWQQTQQDRYRPSRPASNSEFLQQALEESPSLERSDDKAKPLQLAGKIDAARSLSARQTKAKTNTFAPWGVEVLYSLHRRSHRGLHLYKGWCIENACSLPEQLDSMCNTNETISNSFRKQECDWCWPQHQSQHIDKHCTKVSKRAVNAISIICGILLLCMLVIAIVLLTRVLRRRRAAKAGRNSNKLATTASILQEELNGAASHQNLHGISTLGRSFRAAKSRVDNQVIGRRSPTEAAGQTPWYKAVFAKPEKWPESSHENPASSRSRLQKQRTKPLDQEVAIGGNSSHERVPVLPPAPPTSGSRVFPNMENTDQGSVLSGPGTKNSQHDPQNRSRQSSRQFRVSSSGSEQSLSQPTHRRNAGANVYNLHRLTERS